jgi:phage FluMu gp28-like protein
VVVKARRIGFSECVSFERACRALGTRLRRNGTWERHRPASQILLSASFEQSKQLLARVMRHVDFLACIPGSPHVTKRSATRCELSNGTYIVALSTNPETARGYEGDVMLDEWAMAPNQTALWAAVRASADPNLSRPEGYQVVVVSTPLGDDDLFHAMVQGSIKASVHRVDIYTALREGFPLRGTIDDLKAEIGDPETFAQEYECSFLAASARYISRETYEAAVYDFAAVAEQLLYRESASKYTHYLGNDVARKKHLSAIVKWAKDQQGVLWQRELCDVRRGMPWDEQLRWFEGHLQGVSRAAIDVSGIGSMYGEQLQKKHGEGRIELVEFTRQSKEALATGLKLGLERKLVHPREDDTQLKRAVLSMRKVITASKNVTFDTPETNEGHGDEAWAAALGVHAANTVTVSQLPSNYRPFVPQSTGLAGGLKRGGWR